MQERTIDGGNNLQQNTLNSKVFGILLVLILCTIKSSWRIYTNVILKILIFSSISFTFFSVSFFYKDHCYHLNWSYISCVIIKKFLIHAETFCLPSLKNWKGNLGCIRHIVFNNFRFKSFFSWKFIHSLFLSLKTFLE